MIAVMQDGRAREEFTAIFERENDALFRFCFARTSDRELAVELTQESFARLWGKMALGATVPNPRALLYVTARHLVIDWYRKKKSLSIEALSADQDNPFDPKDEKAHHGMELSADAERVLALFSKLSETHRDILILRFLEDRPPREIAELLGINANSVSVRISHALTALRELMGIEKTK